MSLNQVRRSGCRRPKVTARASRPTPDEAFREHDHREHEQHAEDDVAEVARRGAPGRTRGWSTSGPRSRARRPGATAARTRRTPRPRPRPSASARPPRMSITKMPSPRLMPKESGLAKPLTCTKIAPADRGDHRTEHEHRDPVPQHGHTERRGDEILVASRDDFALHRPPGDVDREQHHRARPRPTTPRRCGTRSARRSRTRRW